MASCRPDPTLAEAGTQLDATGCNAQISNLTCKRTITTCQNESVRQFKFSAFSTHHSGAGSGAETGRGAVYENSCTGL